MSNPTLDVDGNYATRHLPDGRFCRVRPMLHGKTRISVEGTDTIAHY